MNISDKFLNIYFTLGCMQNSVNGDKDQNKLNSCSKKGPYQGKKLKQQPHNKHIVTYLDNNSSPNTMKCN